MKRKVILIVIDALTYSVVEPAIKSGKLRTLKTLLDADGALFENISPFPSITPAATCSIVTGEYPAKHDIAGAFWRDGDDNSIAYYGDDFWALMNKGLGEYFDDYLLKLNSDRLKTSTLFEQVEDAGLTAACINYMWFRGNYDHEANTPLLLELIPGVRSGATIKGPSVLALADFVSPKIPGRAEPSSVSGGVLKRFGFHDDVTGDYLVELAQADRFPDFTLAYFPNNDFESHNIGPVKSLSVVQEVDRRLGQFIDAMGGLEKLLEQFCFIVTGDHSHSELVDDEDRRSIRLHEVLKDFEIAPAGSRTQAGQLLVCPNMRATQIYTHALPDLDPAELMVNLLHDDRVDQCIVREHQCGEPPIFYVTTRDRGTLRFCEPNNPQLKDCEQGRIIRDEYGNDWYVVGSLNAVDASITSDEPYSVSYGEYPNALERIAQGFSDSSADIWVTARPGYEFCLPETNIHAAASHGSLHASDSISPMVIAGLPASIELPHRVRIVDIAPLCRKLLGMAGNTRPENSATSIAESVC